MKTPERRAWERLQKFQNVVPRWRDYKNFLNDLGMRPTELYSLRRLRRDLPYGPGNTQWQASTPSADLTQTEKVEALAQELNQTNRAIWRKLALGLTLDQIKAGAKNLVQASRLTPTDEDIRCQLIQRRCQAQGDIDAAVAQLDKAKKAMLAVQKAILEAEVGEIEETYRQAAQKPKPAPEPIKPQPPTPEPIKYTAYDLKLKEEKELARKKLMGADDPFKF